MFLTIEEIIKKSSARGGHFFDKETLEFFGSKVLPKVYGGCYFITSEQDKGFYGSDFVLRQAWSGERRFTIRRCDEEGYIDTVGEFGGFDSLEAAEQAVHERMREVEIGS